MANNDINVKPNLSTMNTDWITEAFKSYQDDIKKQRSEGKVPNINQGDIIIILNNINGMPKAIYGNNEFALGRVRTTSESQLLVDSLLTDCNGIVVNKIDCSLVHERTFKFFSRKYEHVLNKIYDLSFEGQQRIVHTRSLSNQYVDQAFRAYLEAINFCSLYENTVHRILHENKQNNRDALYVSTLGLFGYMRKYVKSFSLTNNGSLEIVTTPITIKSITTGMEVAYPVYRIVIPPATSIPNMIMAHGGNVIKEIKCYSKDGVTGKGVSYIHPNVSSDNTFCFGDFASRALDALMQYNIPELVSTIFDLLTAPNDTGAYASHLYWATDVDDRCLSCGCLLDDCSCGASTCHVCGERTDYCECDICPQTGEQLQGGTFPDVLCTSCRLLELERLDLKSSEGTTKNISLCCLDNTSLCANSYSLSRALHSGLMAENPKYKDLYDEDNTKEEGTNE